MICGALKKDGTECQMKVTSKKGCRYHSSKVTPKRTTPKRTTPKRTTPKRTTPKKWIIPEHMKIRTPKYLKRPTPNRNIPTKEVFLVCQEELNFDWSESILFAYDSLEKAEKKLDEIISEEVNQFKGHMGHSLSSRGFLKVEKYEEEQGILKIWGYSSFLRFYIKKLEVL